MDKKDWVVPLITGVIGVVGALGGGMIAGHYQERAAYQQAQVELAKLAATDKANEIKELKESAAKYIAENDAFVIAVALTPKKEKALIDHLAKVQTAGANVIVIADEELARYTNSVNAYSASVLASGGQSSVPERLSRLATIRAEWMKQLRRSLDVLKHKSEENLTLRSTEQSSAAAELKR